MRTGSAWNDICLLNMSSRGALARAASPPPKGTYIEVRRGSHVIVARVVWTEQHHFGVVSQDAIPIDQVIADADSSTKQAPPVPAPTADRRASARKPSTMERHEGSRIMARALEFCFIAGAGAAFAGLAFGLVQTALAAPMAKVSALLAD